MDVKEEAADEKIEYFHFNESELEEIYSNVKGYCYALSKNKWDGEDLAQESFYKAMKYYDGNKLMNKALLKKIAHNAWMDTIRKQSKETIMDASEQDVKQNAPKNRQLEMAEELVAKLTTKQLIAFSLKEAFQYKITEIADELGMTETAVKGLLLRSRAKMKSVNKDQETDVLPFRYDQQQEELVTVLVHSLRIEDPTLLIKRIPKLLTQAPEMKLVIGGSTILSNSHSCNNLSIAA